MQKRVILLVMLISLVASAALAAPPIWETDYGILIPDPAPNDPWDPNDSDESTDPNTPGLLGLDDAEFPVTLSFPFPFEGFNYTTVFVGTNGCVQLGSLGLDQELDYDLWSYFEEFYDDDDPNTPNPDPIICPFHSDLDNDAGGTIWFNDLGDHAVFTWDEVGTYAEKMHFSKFQLQLFDDGTIIFGYNGVLNNPGESVAADTFGGSLDVGIVVGISLADGSFPDPGQNPWDLNGGLFSAGDTIYQRWCYDAADSCGEGGNDDGYLGDLNSAWDLEMQNVIFAPLGGGGFSVSSQAAAAVPATSELGMMALLFLLAMAGTWILRR